jgi:ribonuclease P protein component
MDAPPGQDREPTTGDDRSSDFGFPRHMRMARRADFDRAMQEGAHGVDARLTMWLIANGLTHPRLGLVVGRRHGNAPRRNRIKRLLREAFRLAQHELPAGYDLVCAPRVGGELTLAGGRESLVRLAKRLAPRGGSQPQ